VSDLDKTPKKSEGPVYQPMTPINHAPIIWHRRTSRSRRGASVRRKTDASKPQQRIGYADDPDCIGKNLRQDRLAECLDLYPIHQRL
jgi:hypothetical protein